MLRTFSDNNLLTLLLLLVITLLAVAKLLDYKRFLDYFKVLINSTYLNTYGKDIKWFDTFNFLLFLSYCISLSVFIVGLNFTPDLSIYNVLIGVFLFYGLKIIIELTLGRLLGAFKSFKLFLFRKLSYKYFMVFFLVPLSALLLFSNILTPNSIITILVIIIVIHVLTYFIVVSTYLDVVKHNPFYFILYICTLEIAPYFILYKHIM